MLLLRAALLELLVLYHVLGGAVLFRRFFPRESPWLAFVLPALIVMFGFNFLEHFIALPQLGWLLPATLIGLGWVITRPGLVWKDLLLPGAIFAGTFTYVFAILAFNPAITANGEGVADMARVLDFCLGNKLPAVDTWCPPLDHGGYYTFQHYGASLLTRLFTLDIGTGYNMGFALTNTLVMFVGAAAAWHIGGERLWICLATLLTLLANFKGASVLLLVWDQLHTSPNLYDIFDARLANDIGDGWNDPNRHNPFGWIYSNPPPVLRMFPPAYDIYFNEFHANIGGNFMTLMTLFMGGEIFRVQRSNWPWICLLIVPIVTIITSTWYVIVVGVLSLGCLAVALLIGRRPLDGRIVLGGAALAFLLIWPSLSTLLAGTYPADFHFNEWKDYTNPYEFLIQWWPIIIPWFCLLFIWGRLSWLVRWLHLAVPLLLIFFEVASFSDRGLTIEKNWGAIYGVGIVGFMPVLLAETGVVLRIVSYFFLFLTGVFLVADAKMSYDYSWGGNVLHLRGDIPIQLDPQKKRLEQVLSRYHGVTVIAGRSVYNYNEPPVLVGFSGNMCYIAWFSQEMQCGHVGEAEARDKQVNAFFDGTLPDPLGFLHSNNITAIMVWPGDMIPNDRLDALKAELANDYYYVDCKGDDPNGYPNNAGVFVKR